MTGVTELGYLTLGVSDLAAWRTFASGVLGLEVVESGDPSCVFLRMDYWHHRITLVEDSRDDLLASGLRVAGPDEFRALAQRLGDNGIAVRAGSEAEAEARHVLEVMFLKDPNGYDLEIFHGPHVQFDKPFHPGRRMHGKFRTGDAGFGHIMQSQTAGFEKIYAFYTLLGMRGGVQYKINLPGAPKPVPLLFLHCNPRQHTFAFAGPGEKRINHMMFEYDAFHDVGLAQDTVRRLGVNLVIEPGSHANDQMFSFYFKNPSGFLNELGWGGRAALEQSEYYQADVFGHAPVPGSMKGFMVPA